MIRTITLLAAIVAAVFVFAVTGTIIPSGRTAYEAVVMTGLVLITVCVMGRAWSSLYGAGGTMEPFASEGPYSVSRNPASVFAMIGAVGMGMQTGSIVVGLICGVIAWLALRVIVTQDERLLLGEHGETYRDYIRNVPRFVPKWSLWTGARELTVPPSTLLWMFRDGLVLLLAQPVAEYLQQSRIVPILIKLP